MANSMKNSSYGRFKAGLFTGAVGALAGPHLVRWLGRRARARLQQVTIGSAGRAARTAAQLGGRLKETVLQKAGEQQIGTAIAETTRQAVTALRSGNTAVPKLAVAGLALTAAAASAVQIKRMRARKKAQAIAADAARAGRPGAPAQSAQPAPVAPVVAPVAAPVAARVAAPLAAPVAEKTAPAQTERPAPAAAPESSAGKRQIESQLVGTLNRIFKTLGLNLRAAAKAGPAGAREQKERT